MGYCPPVSLVGGSASCPSAGGSSSGSTSIVFCISAVPVASVVSVELLLLLAAVVVPGRLDASSSSVAGESSPTPRVGVEVGVVSVSVVLALLSSLLLSNVDTDSSNTFSQSDVLVSSAALKLVMVSVPGPQSKKFLPKSPPRSMSFPLPP